MGLVGFFFPSKCLRLWHKAELPSVPAELPLQETVWFDVWLGALLRPQVDLLEDIRNLESSKHVPDSRFESYINAASLFFCTVAKTTNPSEEHVSLCLSRGFQRQPPSARHVELWQCRAETPQSLGLQQFV